eukprot:GHVN01099564.1.p4 GENE.GHVN01099564.1~~GHVN01099564.1.p4  ORF type:complete len:131 (+),score=1.92 GHVN01099564.1:199-591(+)
MRLASDSTEVFYNLLGVVGNPCVPTLINRDSGSTGSMNSPCSPTNTISFFTSFIHHANSSSTERSVGEPHVASLINGNPKRFAHLGVLQGHSLRWVASRIDSGRPISSRIVWMAVIGDPHVIGFLVYNDS